MSKRAERRRHKVRMKSRAMWIYPHWPDAYKWADHIKGCSCYGCGNPRKWFDVRMKWTMQERRQQQGDS